MRLGSITAVIAVVIIGLTAWIAAGATNLMVAPIVIGLALSILPLIFVGARIHRRSSLRVDLAILLFVTGVLFAVPLHEFWHILFAFISGQEVTFVVSWKSLAVESSTAPVASQVIRLLAPFLMSAVMLVFLPILPRNWKELPSAGLIWGVVVGGALMSAVYALASGLVGGRGDINATAGLTDIPVWALATGVIGMHIITVLVWRAWRS